MNTITTVRVTLELVDAHVRSLPQIADADDATRLLGHLAITEGQLHEILFGIANPVEHWELVFDPESEPADNQPRFDEVLNVYRQLRAATLASLDYVTDQFLHRPPKNPPFGFEEEFATIGQVFLAIANHQLHLIDEASSGRAARERQFAFATSEWADAF